MPTYQVRLSPKPADIGGDIAVTIQAGSDSEASGIAASQNPTYEVQEVHRVGSTFEPRPGLLRQWQGEVGDLEPANEPFLDPVNVNR